MKNLWDFVRQDMIGSDATIQTPFGERVLSYADFTASGRGLHSIEQYINGLLRHYANTHTEDDATGRITSQRLAQAEQLIKERLGADENYKLISVGAGATAAIIRLQQILGIYLPPATRERLSSAGLIDFQSPAVQARRPVVFVGPYEHHSNEISWREGFCEVVEIELNQHGYLDLADLEAKLQDPRWARRPRFGSFSAASNVSGIRTDVYAVARILHRHGARAFFDFSAAAPYVRISVNHDQESYFDAVFFSPHKYIGGPGASGILLIREDIYRQDLPPSISGGGTVTFVNASSQDYINDIEEREKAGTPGIFQTFRSALVLDLQHRLGIDEIARREEELTRYAIERLSATKNIDIIGAAPPEDRLAIFSFNIRTGRGYLHPRFVVRLLNDLFGIQSRAGCSCAGPYGHRLLHIDIDTSEIYRNYIRAGSHGVKPGWVRLNFHYLFTPEDVEFLCAAIEFIAREGHLFLQEYTFDPRGGAWQHIQEPEQTGTFGAEAALAGTEPDHKISEADRNQLRSDYLTQAVERAAQLRGSFQESALHEAAEDLIPFWYMQ
ncbi:MAG: aminotransferase class V-fold PLP-dependent enzyme [Spirochaetaceae bacterium]|nr:MAG: aminotransferase class V-fold PLP-dependent enzyme [Spirochaetaceae bacterium]